MNLVHKTLIPCNELLFCTIRQIVSSDIVEAILIYRHRVELTTLKYVTTLQKVAILVPQSIPVEVSLIWGAVVDQYFYSITENLDFIISDFNSFPHFHQIFITKLENIPLTFETKAISHNLKYICIAGSEDEVIIVDIQNHVEPFFQVLQLDVEEIISIIPAPKNNSFAILISLQESKMIYFLNSETKEIYDKVKVDPPSFKLIYSLSSDKHQIFCVQKRKIVGISTQMTFTTKHDILLASNVVGNNISMILNDENNTFLVYSLATRQENSYEEGAEFTKMFTLPNSLLICYSEGNYIILHIPSVTKTKNTKRLFSDLQSIEVLQYKNTQVKSLAFIDNSLNALSEFGLTSVTNQEPGDLEGDNMEFTADGRLFSLDKELQFYATDSGTFAIVNNMNQKPFKFIQDHSAINMFIYNDSLIQVFSNGIYVNGKRILKELNDICCSAMNNGFFTFVTGKNEIVLYNDNFVRVYSNQFTDRISSISMCDDYIAVALFDSENSMQGKLYLFDYDLEIFGSFIDVPSRIESLIFLHEGSELFALSYNGTIMKIEINKEKGITDLISYIYYGERSTNAIKINEKTFGFISNSIIILYINDHIVSTGIDNTITIGFDSENLSVIRKLEKTQKRTNSKSKVKCMFDYIFVSIDLFEFDDSHIILFPETEQYPALHHIGFNEIDFLLNKNAIIAMKNKTEIKSYTINPAPLTFTCSEINSGVFNLIIVHEDRQHITTLKYTENDKKFKLLFKQNFENELDSILLYRDRVLISTKGELRIAKIDKKYLKFLRAFVPSYGEDHPITYLCEYKDYIWVSYQNLKLSVYQYQFQTDSFSIVAEVYSQFDVSTMHYIDDLTMAVGEKDGHISFYQIPLNASIGAFNQPFRKSGIVIIPKLESVFNCCTNDEISSFVTIPHCILYSTTVGAIGAFIHGMTNEMLLHLHKVQQKIRKMANEKIGFSLKSRDALCSSQNIVDYDLINFYQKFIDPEDKEKLFDFYDISMITNIMQFLTF